MPEQSNLYESFDRNLYRIGSEQMNIDPSSQQPYSSFATLAGGDVDPATLASGETIGTLRVASDSIQSANFVSGTTGWAIYASGDVEFNSGTFRGTLTATTGTIGGFTISSDNIADAANSFGLASTVTGGDDVRFWAGDTFANRATADFRVTEAGAVTASSITITGGAISGASLASIPNDSVTDISIMEMSHNLVFSVTDADTIAWSSGTIVFSNGRTFSISSGNTGNMAALTYIYLDPAVSSTVLQKTTTYSTAMGGNKRLVGTAQNNTVTASFIPYGPGQPLVDGANIGALSIVAGNIAASTITAGKLSVSQLSAIAADLGTITAGTVTGATIRTSASNPKFNMTSTAFQGLNSSGTTIFEVIITGGDEGDVIMGDDATGQYAQWDNSASTFTVNGSPVSNLSLYGNGNDGNVTVNSDAFSSGPITNNALTRDAFFDTLTINTTRTLKTAGFRLFCKTLLDVAGTLDRKGNNGSNGSDATHHIDSGTGTGAPGAGGNGGAALAAGSLGGAIAGANGSIGGSGDLADNTNGVAGTAGLNGSNESISIVNNNGASGGAGGAGGTSTGARTGGAGAAAGSPGTATAATDPPYSGFNLYLGSDGLISTGVPTFWRGGAGASGGGGGGSGGCDNGADNSGGGGGGGGGGGSGAYMYVAAKKITVQSGGVITVAGGNGGNGGAGGDENAASFGAEAGGGGGGGGGGGSGGLMALIYNQLSNSGSITAAGGTGGTGGRKGEGDTNPEDGTAGSNGTDGTAGDIIQLQN